MAGIEEKVRLGYEKLEQGEKLIVGKDIHIEYNNGTFTWVEKLGDETNRVCLSKVAVEIYLYHCDEWKR